jgi:hypothetical protein
LRILAKKAFRFQDREHGKSVTVRHLDITNVPDWVKIDPIFALAVKDGDIEIFESRKEEHDAELRNPRRPNNNGGGKH